MILIVLPIAYGNLLTGLESVDKKHLELAKVFDFGFVRNMRYIYMPQTVPYIRSALSTSLGLAWKAGIAAEVLCDPLSSIGHGIFSSKRDILTADLFAWTAVVILLCFAFEFALARLFNIKIGKKEAKKHDKARIRSFFSLHFLMIKFKRGKIKQNTRYEVTYQLLRVTIGKKELRRSSLFKGILHSQLVNNQSIESTQTSPAILRIFCTFVFLLSIKNQAEQIKKMELPKLPL